MALSKRLYLDICRQFARMWFYAVRVGKNPGVYNSWSECEQQVRGVAKARYRKFPSEEQAWEFVNTPPTPGKAAIRSTAAPAMVNRLVVSQTASTDTYTSPIKKSFVTNTGQYSLGPSPTKAYTSPIKTRVLPKTTGTLISDVTFPTPSLSTAPISGTGVLSSSRLLALKGTLNNISQTVEQLRAYSTQAEEQLQALKQGYKRTREPSSGDNGSTTKQPRTLARHAGISTTSTLASSTSTSASSSGPVSVYTDGCCHDNGRGNPRAGIGVYWGPDDPRNASEPLPGRATNNRAEIHAARHAVEQAKSLGIDDLVIHTDSQFLINSITKWIHKWKKNGWKVASGQDVVNKEDFEQLEEALEGINVTWIHVRGHHGILGNEEADQLANEGARKN